MNLKSISKSSLIATGLGTGSFAMMNITTVVSLRGLSAEAEYGLTSVFFYLFAALFFLVPVSLCAAELATGWPQKGGVFRWISQAFGDRLGLVAIFLQWLATTICFPTMLIFAAVSLAYSLPLHSEGSILAGNALYTLVVVLSVYWFATFINFKGIKSASKISSFAGIFGTLIPAIALIFFGVFFIYKGHPVQFSTNWDSMFPNITHLHNLVLAAGVFLFYSGMEINAVHVRELNNASRSYPAAIGISALLAVVVLISGTLIISAIIPSHKINLVQSLLVSYNTMFSYFGVPWMGNIIALMVAVGALGQVTVIVAGPSRGLYEVGELGYLPKNLIKSNKNGIQRNILLLQAIIVTIMSTMLVCLPSVQATFQILGQLASILYLLMYVLMFGAVIMLRYSQPEVVRPYKIPGGKLGVWLVAGSGLIATLLAFILSFIPPDQISIGSPMQYVTLLICGTLTFISIPLLIYKLKLRRLNINDLGGAG